MIWFCHFHQLAAQARWTCVWALIRPEYELNLPSQRMLLG
jgi:hypothetical protein